jgi:hypothetical protein
MLHCFLACCVGIVSRFKSALQAHSPAWLDALIAQDSIGFQPVFFLHCTSALETALPFLVRPTFI